jgi:uncharacterized protein
MKNIFSRAFFLFPLALCLLPCLAAQRLPAPSGFVNDFAGVMKAQDAEAVESLAAAVKEKTGAELALVTVESFASYAFASIGEFSLALAEAWGVGERGRDNGVLLVLAVAEREVRIEVGYGLEGAIPDSAAGRILDTVVIPAFRAGDFSGGLREGSRAIAAYVVKEKGLELADFDLPETLIRGSGSARSTVIVLSIFFLFVLFIIVMALVNSRHMGTRGGDVLRPGGFGSGSSFGSSGGGGFSGFGGGNFGGGGASRRF